jgi:sRNA-binding carbon storage regulator CsrA
MVVRIGDDIAVTVREFRPDSVVVQVDYPTGLILKNAEGEVKGEPLHGEVPSTGLKAMTALKIEEVLSIGDQITVKVLEFFSFKGHPCKVLLGFRAPANLRITRSERDLDRAKESSDPPEAGA